MSKLSPSVVMLLFTSVVWAEQPKVAVQKPATPEALQAQIEALKPAEHVWRAIAWKTCPLEALQAAREQQKPVIAWVFLGTPTDERC